MDGGVPGVAMSIAGDEGGDRLHVYRQPRRQVDARGEILAGLRQKPRRISPKYFYDSRGARLFDRITSLPAYYLTRAEREIFRDYGTDIARAAGEGRVLIEPGSGGAEKVELLLDALRPRAYVPLEITESHLLQSAERLVQSYPWLHVHAVCADYSDGLPLPESLPGGNRLVFFPGSTIGNFEPREAARFLGYLRVACGSDGALLIGVDLRKDKTILNAAYNDEQGLTAAFNRNALRHVNRLAEGDFDPDRFRHVAFFNSGEGRVEMHLESCAKQTVTVAGESLPFEAGERIHTENSYKYTLEDFHRLAAAAGFRHRQSWRDKKGWFSVHLLDAAEGISTGQC